MPVILDPDHYDLWLDPGMTDADVVSLLKLMAPSRCGATQELT
jgi:putative SOS response-associated peptidase YedK